MGKAVIDEESARSAVARVTSDWPPRRWRGVIVVRSAGRGSSAWARGGSVAWPTDAAATGTDRSAVLRS